MNNIKRDEVCNPVAKVLCLQPCSLNFKMLRTGLQIPSGCFRMVRTAHPTSSPPRLKTVT